MDYLQIAIWVATVACLSGVAVAFFKSESLAVRLGALGGFAVFFFAVILWTPTDTAWFNITMVSILLIAFASNRKRRPEPPPPPGTGPGSDRPDGKPHE